MFVCVNVNERGRDFPTYLKIEINNYLFTLNDELFLIIIFLTFSASLLFMSKSFVLFFKTIDKIFCFAHIVHKKLKQ